jgi:hypothetical protein
MGARSTINSGVDANGGGSNAYPGSTKTSPTYNANPNYNPRTGNGTNSSRLRQRPRQSARDAHAAAARSGCYGCPDPPAAPYT